MYSKCFHLLTRSLKIHISRETKYPPHIMHVLRKSMGHSPFSPKKDRMIYSMPKIDVFHSFFQTTSLQITGSLFRKVVLSIFGLDLLAISNDGEGAKLTTYPNEIMELVSEALNLPNHSSETISKIMSIRKAKIMDLCIKQGNFHTYTDMNDLLKSIYGINLQGISSLEHAKISLFTKNQWLVKSDTDLFVVYTGKGDVDVKVYPTPYFREKFNTEEILFNLKEELTTLGYSYDNLKIEFYYKNQTGESVSNLFKEETIGCLRKSIIYFLSKNNT
ncbi:hypothetical protein ACNRWW_09725 [Metabacillus sp. HB246100]